jgi:hypothetical protein
MTKATRTPTDQSAAHDGTLHSDPRPSEAGLQHRLRPPNESVFALLDT